MSPDKKRRIRLVIALATAVLLAAALIYTSFTAGVSDRQVSDLLASSASGTATDSSRLVGRVVDGSVDRSGERLRFEIADLADSGATVPVSYTGQIPDPFREGREVLLTGRLADGTFEAEQDSLITKCPSKFQAERDPDHVVFDPKS